MHCESSLRLAKSSDPRMALISVPVAFALGVNCSSFVVRTYGMVVPLLIVGHGLCVPRGSLHVLVSSAHFRLLEQWRFLLWSLCRYGTLDNLQKELAGLQREEATESMVREVVTPEDVAKVVSKWTGVWSS